MKKVKQLTQYQTRLINQLKSIENEEMKEILMECIFIQYKHRSNDTLARKEIKNCVDRVILLSEA